MPDKIETVSLESKVQAAAEAVTEETFNVSFNSAKFAKVIAILGTEETAESLITGAVDKELARRLNEKRSEEVATLDEALRCQYVELTK